MLTVFIYLILQALVSVIISLPFVLVGLTVYCIINKKFKLLVCTVAAALVFLFFVIFPRKFPYADIWIKGRTKEEIIAVYGEPDYGYSSNSAIAYKVKSRRQSRSYYWISFDENGKADDIRLSTPPGG